MMLLLFVIERCCMLVCSSVVARLIPSLIFLFSMHGVHCVTIILFSGVFYYSTLFFKSLKKTRKFSVWIIALLYLWICDIAKSVPGGIWYFGFKRIVRKYSLFEGFYPNWEVLFNLTILKMISFAMDYYEAQDCWSGVKRESQNFIAYPERRERQSVTYACLSDFSFLTFCSYLFYFPLFIAGPIITFNDWCFQCRRRNPNLQIWRAIRSFLLPFVTFEIFNHFFYVRCMKEFGSFKNFTFWQTISYSYWSLKFLWFKFLVIWRYFRACSLMSGIEPQDNMLRCMSNHLSTRGFWRSWHASFNNWMIRYVYLPLGGSKNIFWNIWIIFGFAAAWHNFNFTMFCWGMLIPLFISPELLCGFLVKRYQLNNCSSYRLWQGIGSSLNILFLIVANMVGYALDEKTVMNLFLNITKQKGKLLIDFALLMVILFSVCQLMLYKRDQEEALGRKYRN